MISMTSSLRHSLADSISGSQCQLTEDAVRTMLFELMIVALLEHI